jgi:hypothetical protein
MESAPTNSAIDSSFQQFGLWTRVRVILVIGFQYKPFWLFCAFLVSIVWAIEFCSISLSSNQLGLWNPSLGFRV